MITKHAEQGTLPRNSALVSFIIPVRNDARRLRRCLATIRDNIHPDGWVEVIVVDNGSDDDSADVARETGATVLTVPGLPVSELRNRGAAVASGGILAFVDADHEIVPEWVASVVETFGTDPRAAAVGALCEAPSNGTWVQRTYDLLRRRAPGMSEVEWLGSGNMAVRRDAFVNVGGFDTTLQTCEDVDLCRRLRMRGHRIVQDSRLRNIHLGDPATLGELFRGELWRGRDNLRASLRGPVSLRELPSIVLPITDLAFLAIGIIGIATWFRFGSVLAVLAVMGIFAGAMLRVVRMLAQSRRITLLGCGQALTVAVTYDLARACALVRPGGHESRKRAR